MGHYHSIRLWNTVFFFVEQHIGYYTGRRPDVIIPIIRIAYAQLLNYNDTKEKILGHRNVQQTKLERGNDPICMHICLEREREITASLCYKVHEGYHASRDISAVYLVMKGFAFSFSNGVALQGKMYTVLAIIHRIGIQISDNLLTVSHVLRF
jgi:hypothetical protein